MATEMSSKIHKSKMLRHHDRWSDKVEVVG